MISLQALVESSRATTARRRRRRSETELLERLAAAGLPGRDPGRLRAALACPGLAVIAEVKGASPVEGVLRADLQPCALAREYEEAGAVAISVLTEECHFGGSLEHLSAVAAAVDRPVLRKDFIVDPYQVHEAALAGASGVLLIAEVLDAASLADLVAVAHGLGLDALVEVHDASSVPAAVASGSGLIGVNNRDLETMQVDWRHALEVAVHLPADVVRVAESGIDSHAQLQRLHAAGYDAALIGSSLVRAANPAEALRGMLGGGD